MKLESRELSLDLLSQIDAPFDLPLENESLIKTGVLFLEYGFRMKERFLILFGNALLVCKINRQGYTLESGYTISDLEMPNEPTGNFVRDIKSPKNAVHLYIISENLARISLIAESEELRNEWMKAFEQIFNLYCDNASRNTNQQLDKDLKTLRSNIKAKSTNLMRLNTSQVNIKKKVSIWKYHIKGCRIKFRKCNMSSPNTNI